MLFCASLSRDKAISVSMCPNICWSMGVNIWEISNATVKKILILTFNIIRRYLLWWIIGRKKNILCTCILFVLHHPQMISILMNLPRVSATTVLLMCTVYSSLCNASISGRGGVNCINCSRIHHFVVVIVRFDVYR